MSDTKTNVGVYVRTDEVRLSFPALWTPRPRAVGNDKLTYQATLLLPPTVDLKPYKVAMIAAMEKKFGKAIQLPAKNIPIKDAAEKAYDGYLAGWRFVSCHNTEKPTLVNRQNQPVSAESNPFYAGCWVRAFINAFAWNHPTGGKGVSFGLVGLQFVRDDVRLDGRANAMEAFEPLGDLEDGGDFGAGEPDDEELTRAAPPQRRTAPRVVEEDFLGGL